MTMRLNMHSQFHLPLLFLARLVFQQSRLFGLLLACLVLASCATRPTGSIAPGQTPNDLINWRVEGKLGFRSPEKNGSAWINWLQKGDSYQLQLNGPFGASATRIEGDSQHAVLSQSGREDVGAASGEELTEWLFGWPLPVSQMPYWIKGLPAPDSQPQSQTKTADNHLASLQQQGWHLTYSDYQRQGEWQLPSRIQGAQGNHSFTLVIKKWHPLSREN